MHNYQDLKVWQKGIEVAQKIYELTSPFPSQEKFGLTSQIRRSAVSIASNIAEGAGRYDNTAFIIVSDMLLTGYDAPNTDKDFINFISIAAGSAYELETQLIIAMKEKFLTNDDFEIVQHELGQIKKMLYSLKRKLLQTS